MRISTLIKTALSALSFAALVGCGSSGSGTMNVHLVDAPGDYAKITLDVKSVAIHGPNGWQTLSDNEHSVDLLTLVNGVTDPVATQVDLVPGHYDQIRLVLGNQNSVSILGEAQPQPLVVPSGLKSGVKVNVALDVQEGQTVDLYIDFDGNRSIFLHTTGSGKYMLRPVVRAVVRQGSGVIQGSVSNDATVPELLSGVTVTAQTIDPATGTPTIVRSVRTDASGHYTLDLLPAGATYYVVAQIGEAATIVTPTQPTPVSDEYGPAASAPIAVASVPVTGVDLQVKAVGPDGADVFGAIGPSSAGESDADVVTARQHLNAGATADVVNVAVRAVTAIVDSGERYDLGTMPAGSYEILVTRTTLDATTSNVTTVSSPVEDVVVSGGVAVPPSVDLAFP
jgi:hypothetical protein